MDFLSVVLYIVLPLLTAGYFFLKKKYSYFDERGIPYVKPTSWILGSLSGVGKKYHMAEFLQRVYEEVKGKDVIGGFFGMTEPTIVITDLELIKSITVRDFNNFVDRGMYVNEENEPITGHLFAIEGEKWRFLRNKLSPVFTSGKIKMMYNTISDKGDNFVKAIERAALKGSVEMKDISNRFTIDVVSSCAFGMEANTLKNENEEFVVVFKKVFGEDGVRNFRFLLLSTFPKISKFLNLRLFGKQVEDFFMKVVKGTINYREANNVKRNDFLNMLIQLKNNGSIEGEISTETRKLTVNECVAQAFIFFFAGADTSSTVIMYALTELGANSEIQEKLRGEILEKTSDSEGEITYDNLHEMTYLNQVMNEALRKYPPAFLTFRNANSDYNVPNSKHVIKKGMQVMIPNIGIHYDERYWKNPYDFNPDRFTTEETAKRPTLAFMPFGEGPRNCIGMRFAQVNVKFAIATVIKNFRLTLDTSKTQLPLRFDPKAQNIAPIGGSWVNFERIDGSI